MIETNVLIAILLWCGQPTWTVTAQFGKSMPEIEMCRQEAIVCASGLKDPKLLVPKCLSGK